jgi:hypothetical protein
LRYWLCPFPLQRRSKRLNNRTVAVVLEEAAGVFGTESRDRSAHHFEKSFSATRLGFTRQAFELAEGLLDEPTTVRLYTRASSSGYTIILSSQLDPLPVSMVSARQLMQPAKPFELRFVGPHYPASSVTG